MAESRPFRYVCAPPTQRDGVPMKNVYNNVLEVVGNTPLVRLNSMTEGLKCNVWAKVEFTNPGGSVKDRIAMHIIDEAERTGAIKPGGVVVGRAIDATQAS